MIHLSQVNLIIFLLTPKQQFTVKVEKGDIIILASDGLFDNLFDEDILEIVCEQISPKLEGVLATGSDIPEIDPQTISDALALRAKSVSEDSDNGSSPFQTRAMKEGMYYQVRTWPIYDFAWLKTVLWSDNINIFTNF